MRLFIAILFDEESKDKLYDSVVRMGSFADGSFTQRENLHLTVNFIGETKRLTEVKQAMEHAVNETGAEPFLLSVGGLGKFKRNEGDIYWIGVEREQTLWRLQKELVKELKNVGYFDIDDREYKPHLTLARRVCIKETMGFKEFEAGIEPVQMQVKKISLMKSERILGKLVYTEIFHVGLHFDSNP